MEDFFGNELKIGDKIIVPNFIQRNEDFVDDGFKPLLQYDIVLDFFSDGDLKTHKHFGIEPKNVIKIKE